MADIKTTSAAPSARIAEVVAKLTPELCHAARISKDGKTCICLFAMEEDARRRATNGKCVAVAPGLFHSDTYVPGDAGYEQLAHAVDRLAE